MNGYQHLITLALAGENVARQAYQADAYGVAGSKAFGEVSLERALAAADQVTAIASEIRMKRGSQTDAS